MLKNYEDSYSTCYAEQVYIWFVGNGKKTGEILFSFLHRKKQGVT